MSSVAADGCFLSGECSFFLCFNQKHFIALLRVFCFAAVCFGCLHRDFLLKTASERVPDWSRPISVLDKFAKVLCYL